MLRGDQHRSRGGLGKLLLTPEEAADLLSIGRSKVYELMSDGRLASVRIDACRRVPISALVDFVESLQTSWAESAVERRLHPMKRMK
ncbi:MAG: helix-turn-helix domain-containing protein [Acidimicrobiia bacterium]